MSKHTPGPWTYKGGFSQRVYLIDTEKGRAIGEICYMDTRNPADAALIAEAPTMFDLLKDVQQFMCQGNRETDIALLQSINQAIGRIEKKK